MSVNQVPRVSIEETVTSLSVPQPNEIPIAIVGASELQIVDGTQIEANKVYKVVSSSQAKTLFGTNTSQGRELVKIIDKAFEEGANTVHAVSIGDVVTGAESTLTANAAAGSTSITVSSGTGFTAGDEVFIGTKTNYRYEEKRVIASVAGTTITLTEALKFQHYTNEFITEVDPKISTDYVAAIAELRKDPEKIIILSQNNDDATAALFDAMTEISSEDDDNLCVYFRGFDKDVSEAQAMTKSQAHNSDRVFTFYPALKSYDGQTMSGAITAAACAGAVVGNGIPKLNHNYSELTSFGGVKTTIDNYDALFEAGCCPIIIRNNNVFLSRLRTTMTTENSIPNTDWQEGSIRLNVDQIERAVKSRIEAKFLQSGNIPAVREAIKQEVIVTLKQFVSLNILVAAPQYNVPAFKEPVVTTDLGDSSKVNVEIEISPGKPLNFVTLSFNIIT